MNETWPPPYTLRRSKRAKRINLRLCPQKGLELVVPTRASEKTALNFLNDNATWVKQNWHILTQVHANKELPVELKLHSLQQQWQIRYETITNHRRLQLIQLPNELVLMGPSHDYAIIIKELNNWLRIQAERYLLLWLRELSSRTQLLYNDLTIRGQRTRWGSCTHEKNISLNYKLMFLPFEYVDYVLIHELCHTVHLNHSDKFWALVEKYCPDHQRLRREILKADGYIPKWLV